MGEETTKPSRTKLIDIGPSWIVAIATLISALVAAASFIAGRATAPSGNGQAPNSLAPSVSSNSTGAPDNEITPSPGNTPIGAVLADTSVTIPDGFGITFYTGSMKPQQDSGDLQLGTGFDVGQLDWVNGQLATLQSGNPTYSSCAADTMFIATTDVYTAYSPGTVLCYTGHEVVAAITITAVDTSSETSAPVQDIKVNVIVWKS